MLAAETATMNEEEFHSAMKHFRDSGEFDKYLALKFDYIRERGGSGILEPGFRWIEKEIERWQQREVV